MAFVSRCILAAIRPADDLAGVLPDRIFVVDLARFVRSRESLPGGEPLALTIEHATVERARELATQYPELLTVEGDFEERIRAVRRSVRFRAEIRYQADVLDPGGLGRSRFPRRSGA